MSTLQEVDVALVGGGPVGLSLALHLERYGVSCLVVEAEPDTRWHPKGNSNNARTMEIFRRLGIADGMRALGLPADHPYDVAFFTRLSGFEIARGRTPSRRERLAQRAAAARDDQIPEPPHRANQMFIERFLLDETRQRKNVTLRFGWTADGFVQDESGVTLALRKSDESGEERWRARYLVGCDGGRGLVRRSLGIKYGGEEKLMDVFIAGLFTSVHLKIPALAEPPLSDRRAWMYAVVNHQARAQIIALDGAAEFMMHIPTKTGIPMDAASVDAAVRRAVGSDIDVEVLGFKQWHAGSYLVAERYREGRIFIAGDAAHLYAPTGGFGMNTGIEDSTNLGWKLGAVLQGWGGEALLDSYEVERRGAALRAADAARALGKSRHDVTVTETAEEDSPAGEAARRAIAASGFVQCSHFTLPEARDSMGVILGLRYDSSPVVVRDTPQPTDEFATYTPSSAPGGRAPHLWLGEGRGSGDSLYDRIGVGLTLLQIGGDPVPNLEALHEAAARRGIPFDVVVLPAPGASRLYDRRLQIVRPDLFIAWRGDALPDDLDALLAVVTGTGTGKGGLAAPIAAAAEER
jgi:2-polyprenyl-6-methoxyphenol hydroxylase-like FAD-dependent oxidoreductase